MTVTLLTDTWPTEVTLLLVTFVLTGLIGLERQFRQKSSGFRTHVLVGMGAATFTLVSGLGFSTVLGEEVVLDPSRIAAQIVSGIGFLGAGVIFLRRDLVVGLTTAATIWVTAAVGMAAGAGMIVLASALTALDLLCLMVLAPLMRRIPTEDRRSVLRIVYEDGRGVLRQLLTDATEAGFTASIVSTSRHRSGSEMLVEMDVRFQGRPPVQRLIPQLDDVDGVRSIRFRDAEDAGDGDL